MSKSKNKSHKIKPMTESSNSSNDQNLKLDSNEQSKKELEKKNNLTNTQAVTWPVQQPMITYTVDLASLIKENQELKIKNEELLNENKELKNCKNKCESKLEEIAKEYDGLKNRYLNKIDDLIKENNELKESNKKLQEENEKLKKEISLLKDRIKTIEDKSDSNEKHVKVAHKVYKRQLLEQFKIKYARDMKINVNDVKINAIDKRKYKLTDEDIQLIKNIKNELNYTVHTPNYVEIAMAVTSTTSYQDTWIRIFRATYDKDPNDFLNDEDDY